jgi:hypothetical protein
MRSRSRTFDQSAPYLYQSGEPPLPTAGITSTNVAVLAFSRENKLDNNTLNYYHLKMLKLVL